jgi:hydroxymethylbilane synthase
VRGNVDTRLRKLETDGLDAIVVAAAGLMRMSWEDRISDIIPPEICLPAVGQGALGVEMRSDDAAGQALFQPLTSPATQAAVTAERCFLAHLQGGCQVPIAAWAIAEEGRLWLRGLICDVDGLSLVRSERWGLLHAPQELGEALAEELLGRGGEVILRDIYGSTWASEAGNLP